jgi:hypothetical protein
MKVCNIPNIIPASTVMNATINSQAIELQFLLWYSIQIVFTGTPTGSFKLQASDDPVAASKLKLGANGVPQFVPTNWTDLPNQSQSVVAAGSAIWNIPDVGYTFVRAVYTDTSGGSSTAIITVSSFNGKGF